MGYWVVSVVLGLSAVVDLFTGTAHTRANRVQPRDENPRAFWTVVLLKVSVALGLVVVWAMRRHL